MSVYLCVCVYCTCVLCVCNYECMFILPCIYNTDECPENCVLFCASDGIEVTMTCYRVKLQTDHDFYYDLQLSQIIVTSTRI